MAQGTMQKVTNDSSSNYCKMPDGTLMQWGTVGGYYSGDRELEVTFPIQYISNPTVTLTNAPGSSTENYRKVINSISYVNKDKFKIYQTNVDSTYNNVHNVVWNAVGRWK